VGVSLLAPLTQQLVRGLGLNPSRAFLLMILGVNAGALSPVTPTSLVVHALLEKSSVTLSSWSCFAINLLGHALVIGLVLCRVRQLGDENSDPPDEHTIDVENEPMFHRGSLAPLMGLSILAILPLLGWLGLLESSALAFVVMRVLRFDLRIQWQRLPWELILMVCCMSGLALWSYAQGYFQWLGEGLLNYVGGYPLLAGLLLLTALISIVASSSAVVLPLFLMLLASLEESALPKIPMMYAVIFASHVVDVSPFSTLGAIAVSSQRDPGLQSQM